MKAEKSILKKMSSEQNLELYTLTNDKGIKADITNYGGIIISLFVPDKHGNLIDIVLGYDDIDNYSNTNVYFGALIGRCANRIKNGKFYIDGIQYQTELNDNKINHLHGGNKGFNQVLWNAEITQNGLELVYLSKDGEENYPGNLTTKVIYYISDNNELIIDYYAVCDKSTIINLTNHSYFNLEGHDCKDILDQYLWINSSSFTQIDKNSIPTGKILSVKNTSMDFNIPTKVGKRIRDDYEQLKLAGGYDHNWILPENSIKNNIPISSLYSDKTGILMEVSTTLPGIQIYSGNYIQNSIDKIGKNGIKYGKNSGICFETQYFPNCMNIPQFKSCIFKPEQIYHNSTTFKFSIKN